MMLTDQSVDSTVLSQMRDRDLKSPRRSSYFDEQEARMRKMIRTQVCRTLCVAVCLGTLTFGAIGCAASEKSSVSSPGYWKRVFRKIGNDFHEFRTDFDRVIWDLEDRPLEDY